MSSHAWLDSLSEDWISQPGTLNSKPPTLNGNGATPSQFRSSGGASGSGSKIPRPRTNSHAAERKFAGTPRGDSSVILIERTPSDINIAALSNSRFPSKLSEQLRQPSFLRGHRASKSYSESPAGSLAGSVIHNSVNRRSNSSSPGKNKGNTPEWRRLINGGQLDMFTNSAATGLERMFEPPPPGKSSLGQTNVDDQPAVEKHVAVQSPPAQVYQYANHEIYDEPSSDEEFSSHPQPAQSNGRSVKYRLNDDARDDISQASNLSSPPRSTHEEGVTPGSSNLSSPSFKPPGMLGPQSRVFSNQSAAQHEVFSPILIAKQSSEDGKVDFAPVGLSASELQQRLQKLQDDQFLLSDSQGSGSRNDSRTGARSHGTEAVKGLKPLSSFVNVRRGGQSADDSFHHRVLTPAIGNTSDLLPEESLQASTPKQFPSLRIHAPSNSDSRSHTPPVPAAPFSSPEKKPTQPPASGVSPLKLFGQYDTFTNQIFLRRISQFEGSNSTPSTELPPGARKVSADMLRHVLDPASRNPSGSQQVIRDDAVHKQRSSRTFSQFGAGELDGFAFNEDFTRHTDDSGDESVVHRSVSFGTNKDTSPRVPSNIVIGKRRQTSDVTTSTNVRTLSRELATKAVSILSTPKHSELAAEYKRHLTSPSKNPTPKRRRTLHQADIAFGADDDDQLMELDLSSHQVQLVNGKKRKNARPGDRQQMADANVLASRDMLRPRTPSISRKSPIQKDILLHEDSPVLQEEIAKIQRALPQNAKNQNLSNDGGRKPSIKTEDYLSMAQKIMAAIRGKSGVPSGLESLEESDDEYNRQTEDNTADDVSFQESTRERFSRPPSREGPPILRAAKRQEDPDLADHLKQYEEHSDLGDIIAASLRSLGVSNEDIKAVQALEAHSYSSRSENSDSKTSESSPIVSDLPNIRISEPNRYENSTAAEQAERFRDRFPSHGSGSDSAFSTVRTGSSRNSDTRRTIAPESVSHLIGDQVGGMILDKKLNVWVKEPKPRPARSKRERSNTLVSDHSEDDPFAGIPDLPVDTSRELQNLRLKIAQHQAESMRPSSTTKLGKNGLTPKQGGVLKPILVKDFADRQGKPEEARSPSRLMEQFVEADDEDVEHEITLHDDRLGETSPKRRAQVNFSSPVSIVIQDLPADGISEEQDTSPVEPIVLHLPKPSEPRRRRNVSFQPGNGHSLPKVRSNSSAPPRRVSVKGPDFIPRPVSVIEERDEDSQGAKSNGSRVLSLVGDQSLAVPSPTKPRSRQTSLNIVVSTPAARRTPQPRPENAEVISQYVGNLSLSPLSDFTAHRTPSYALEVSYVLGDQNLVTGDGSHPHMSQAVRQLVDKIAEVEAFEPFWEDMKELELRDKSLGSLHMLDRFCGRLIRLDVSQNAIRALDGIPSTVRELSVPCNLLSDLTAWDRLSNLQFVDVSNNTIKSLSSFRSLVHLRELIADNTGLVRLDGIKYHESLLKVRARGNAVEEIDFEGTSLQRLATLDLEGNKIRRMENLNELSALSVLNLKDNCLAEFAPPEFVPLRHLDVSGNRLRILDLTSMGRLEQVSADRNRLATVEGLGRTPKLDSLSLREQGGSRAFDVRMLARAYEVRKLFLSGNRIGTFVPTRHFLNLQLLDLANCGLQRLPEDLGGMMPNLRVLNLNFNGLLDISGLQGIPRLKRLFVAGNRFTDSKSLFKCLSGFPCLTEVDLRDTALTQGFYPSIHLALERKGSASHSRLDPYKLPNADPSRDAKFCALLDMDTRIQRRIYERKFVRACQALQQLDGLPVNKRVRHIKDVVWKAMVKRGLLLRPDGSQFDLFGVTLEEDPSILTDATGNEELQAQSRDRRRWPDESSRWGAENSFA